MKGNGMRGNGAVVAEGVHRLTNGVSNFYLIEGDALVTRNPLTGRTGPQIMPAGLNGDSAQALRSLDNLGGLTADVLLAGHGEPWTDGMAEAISRAKSAGVS